MIAEDSSESVVERYVALIEADEVAHSLAEHMVTRTRHGDLEAAQRWAGRCGELEAPLARRAGAGSTTGTTEPPSG